VNENVEPRKDLPEEDTHPREERPVKKPGAAKSLAIKIALVLTALLGLLITAFAFAVRFLVSDLAAAGVSVEPSAIFSYTKPLMYMVVSILTLVLCAALPAIVMKGRVSRPWLYSLTLSAGFVFGSAFGLFSVRHYVQTELVSIGARMYASLAFSNMLEAGLLFTVIGGFAGLFLGSSKENSKALGIVLLIACIVVMLAYMFFFGPSLGGLK